MTLVEQIIDVAKEIELTDPIDWGMLSIDEDAAYHMIATGVLENYLLTDADSRDMILLSVATKLAVENFVLNLKLASKE